MDREAYTKWVNRYLNEYSDWEEAMCKVESKVTAMCFERTEKRKAIDVEFTPVKKIKIEREVSFNPSMNMNSSVNLYSNGITASMENLMIEKDAYNLRKRKTDDVKMDLGINKKSKTN